MEKEPKPFSEEKAEQIMKTDGLEERSQKAQDAFEAGEMKAKNDLSKLSREEFLAERVKINIQRLNDLAPQTYDRLKNTKDFDSLMRHGFFAVPEDYSRVDKFNEIIDGLAQAGIEIETLAFNEHDKSGDYDIPRDYQAKLDKIAKKYPHVFIVGKDGSTRRVGYLKKEGVSYYYL